MQSETLFQEGMPRILTFASPKGGLGTSILLVNLGIQLAKKGKSVLVIDAALTEASCHLALGMALPERHLGSLVTKRVADVREAIVTTPVANLSLLAGAPDVYEAANMAYLMKQKIICSMPSLNYDYVLVDAGAGTGADTLDFLLAASWSLLVCQPTPPTLETLYRFVRALIHRLLQESLTKKRYQALARFLHPTSPLDGLWDMSDTRQEDLDCIERGIQSRRFSFVLTGLLSEKEARLGHQVEMLVRRHFLLPVRYLGGVEWDAQAAAAARSLEAIAKAHPLCPFSMATEKLANIILKEEREQRVPEGHLKPKPVADQHAYELLDLPFDAAPKDIQLAYARLLEPYLETSSLSIGLYGREEKEAMRDRLEWAYKTLINSRERQHYDEDLMARGVMEPEQRVAEYREQSPEGFLHSGGQEAPLPKVAEDAAARRARREAILAAILEEVKQFDGPGIKRIREAQNISIEEIVSETHIRSWYIESIEEERFDALPAPVYVKGFVRQIAQYLHIEPGRVLADYLQKYQHWRLRHPE